MRRRGEAELLRVARGEQPAGEQDLVGERHVVPLEGPGLRADDSASRPISSSAAGPGHDEVVRHQVGVLEDDLDRLAGLDDEPVLVEEHLVDHRAQPDHPDAQVAQLAADQRRLVGRKQARQRVAQLQGVECGRGRPVAVGIVLM